MLALSSRDQVHLSPTRSERARILTLHAEQNHFSDVPEIETDATTIRPAVFPSQTILALYVTPHAAMTSSPSARSAFGTQRYKCAVGATIAPTGKA